jgi:hypothetical protein
MLKQLGVLYAQATVRFQKQYVKSEECNGTYYIVTFISIHSVIICVVFFSAYMRCNRLYPLNPGVTNNKIACHIRSYLKQE